MPKEDFLGLESVAHLAAGGETPPLRSHADIVSRFFALKAKGYEGRKQQFQLVASAKERLGELVGMTAGDVALVASASTAVNMLTTTLEWHPGDNVVMQDLEYPGVVYPWVRLRRLGVEIRVVRHLNWDVPTRAMIDAIDSRTRVVAISQVSYLTGVRHDIESISVAAHSRGALLLMDSSHAAGVVPVPASLADFTTFCCYKFMLAVHGIGVCVWNRARVPSWTPLEVGWASTVGHAPIDSRLVYTLKHDAGRLEVGNPSVIGAHILGHATTYLLGHGIGEIEAHVLRLGALLRDGLASLGVEVMTPTDPMRRAASICFRADRADELRRELEQDGVLVWADEGRIRCSLHGYVDDEDVDRCVRAVKRALQR